MKALAMAAAERAPQHEGCADRGGAGLPGFELVAWFALYAPAERPRLWSIALRKPRKPLSPAPNLRKRPSPRCLSRLHGPEGLAAFTKTELEFWGKVISSAKIKIE